MQHQGTKVIETERLILRPFETKDIEPSFKNWTHDDEVTKFLRWQTHEDISVTEEILGSWISGYKELAKKI